MKMASSEKRQSLVYLQRLRTPALIVLLLFVETLLGTRFQCPRKKHILVIYCLMYLFLPACFLVISNLLLRSRRSSNAFPSQTPPPATHVLILIIQVGKAPLIWVFVVLLNEKFLSCLFIDVHYLLFPSLQICSLTLLVLCVILELYLPRIPFLQKHLLYYNRKRHEELLLLEIEVSVQEAADEKRKTFAQSMINPDLDKLNPGAPGMQDVILHLIQQYQEKVQKGFTGEESRGAELIVQEVQSETPPQINEQN